MYYGGYYGMYWDPTYILVIIGMVICLLASARVKSTYAKFNRVRSHSGITAAEAAEKILHGAGIYDVEIRHISGDLTDNYDPSNRVLNLSDATFRSSSVAAIGVAAHECGHAIQDMLQQRLLLFYSFCVSFYCLATAGMIKRYDRN